MARPRLPENEKKKVRPVRLSDDEMKKVHTAASEEGMADSEWMREKLLAAAVRSGKCSTKTKGVEVRGIEPRAAAGWNLGASPRHPQVFEEKE